MAEQPALAFVLVLAIAAASFILMAIFIWH